MKYTLIYFGILILVMGLASAEVQELSNIKQGTCISLPQSEFNTTFQTIFTIQYPDKTLHLISANMTKRAEFYNYSFCDTQQIGKYIVNGYSDKSTWAYSFNVGNIWIPMIICLFAIILLGIGLTKENPFFGLFSGFLLIILGIYSMSYGLLFISDKYTEMFSYVILGLGVIIAFASVYEIYSYGSIIGDED